MKTDENAMLAWLEKRHAALRALEDGALACLDANDAQGYREAMRARAENLAAIHTDAAPLLARLPQSLAGQLAEQLAGFAQGAKNALGLDSVFYMSALLYPDDHRPGDPDNLALCVAGFKNAMQ